MIHISVALSDWKTHQEKFMSTAMDYLDGYEEPKKPQFYTKLQNGKNRLRLLSKPIYGWEDWIGRKPARFELHKKPAKSFDPEKKIKEFWAVIVYNYDAEQIQVWSTCQATIIKGIKSLCAEKKWGSPFGYDIEILKSGEDKDTRYFVSGIELKPVEPFILEAFREKRCNLKALFSNQDPFSEEAIRESWTPLANETHKIVDLKEEKLTVNEITELARLLGTMPKEFCDEVQAFMKKQKIENYDDIPRPMYERLMKKIKGGN
jgi:hypothetical protein